MEVKEEMSMGMKFQLGEERSGVLSHGIMTIVNNVLCIFKQLQERIYNFLTTKKYLR